MIKVMISMPYAQIRFSFTYIQESKNLTSARSTFVAIWKDLVKIFPNLLHGALDIGNTLNVFAKYPEGTIEHLA